MQGMTDSLMKTGRDANKIILSLKKISNYHVLVYDNA